MLKNSLRLPWNGNNVPHGLIDILRGCNISCENCYNSSICQIKSFEQVKEEIDLMISFRQVHSITLIGGEPLLHPNLLEIVEYISRKNIYVEIFTNGVLLTEEILGKLKKLKVSVIFIHVEKTQKRPELPANATEEDAKHLRTKLAKMIYGAGLECGMSITSYKNRLEDVKEVIQHCKETKEITYLLVTLYRDFLRFKNITGDVRTGMCGNFNQTHIANDQDYATPDILPYLKDSLDLTPFAFVGSNKDKNDARWVSYLIANFYPEAKNESPISLSLSASLLEKAFLKISFLLTGRHSFYQPQNAKQLKSQIKLNALLGGNYRKNKAFLSKISKRTGELNALRVLIQNPAQLDEDGTLRHCDNCPDAVIKNGKLVPVCISDCVN